MAKYNSILSDDKIQKVFDKLQMLNADFISFGDFFFGCCIVSFKQKTGDIYKSGSVLVDENGEIIPIKINGKSYDGLDCIEPGKDGSSLLLLGHITDLDGNKTQYLHYAIDIHEERYDKPYWHWEEGIFDTEKIRVVFDEDIKGIQAKLWTEKLMCISYLDNEDRKYGVIKKSLGKWDWLIKASFAFVDYIDDKIFTYNNDDIKTGKGQLYELKMKPLEFCENNGKMMVTGTIVNSPKSIIRNGKYAGAYFSSIECWKYSEEDLANFFFLVDKIVIDWPEKYRAYRDSAMIKKALLIDKKEQIVCFEIPTYVDKDNNVLEVTTLIDGLTFEEAYLKHYDYINELIKNLKIKVKECVFSSMLKEDYANNENPYYNENWNDDYNSGVICGNRFKYFRDTIISSRDNICNILDSNTIYALRNYIKNNYYTSIEEEFCFFKGKVATIGVSPNNENDYESVVLLVNRDGKIIDNGYTDIRVINDDVILYEIGGMVIVENESEPNNYTSYYEASEQGIINYKGDLLFKGDLGNLSAASVKSQYLLLEKPKFTEIERDKIEYYLSEYVGEERDSCECPGCGGKAYWEEDEECYVCEDCEVHVEGEHKDRPSWKLSKKQLLAADNFEDVLSSEKVNHGQFITETEEERNNREYWEQEMQEDPEWQEEMRAIQEEREFWSDDEQDENYLEGKLYSLFSISKKSFLIPFQKCKILVNPPGYNLGIYLVDEQKEERPTVGISLPFEPKLKKGEWVLQRSYWNGEYYHTLRGTVFHTIFDTFRYGPLTGMTLSLAFKKDFQTLVKYLQNGCVFITTNALKQLCQKYYNDHPKDIERIILLRDLSFEFEGLKEGNDIIDGKASYYGIVEFGRDRFYDPIQDKGWHNDESLKDVVNNNPDYIIGLIKNNKIEVSNKILSDFTDKTICNRLKNAFEVQEKKRMEEEDRWPDYEPDYNDYERDTWNAMTDGQYGEMPEGFDGDYDFTGH